jgi:hypothetical protein
MGAAKATATPAAELALNTSRRLPIVNIFGEGCTIVEVILVKDPTCDISHATCNMYEWSCSQIMKGWRGPSFPRDMPLATLRVKPTAFTRRVRRPRNFRMTKPERMVLTSGIPLPAAVYRTLT